MWKWLKENSFIITAIGSILFILNLTGFSINIPEFYKSLDVEGRIMFVFILNIVITILAFVYILNRINKSKNE